MALVYRIYRRDGTAMQVMAEIRGPQITGPFAELIEERLILFGYPRTPLEQALLRLRNTSNGYLGFDRIHEPD